MFHLDRMQELLYNSAPDGCQFVQGVENLRMPGRIPKPVGTGMTLWTRRQHEDQAMKIALAQMQCRTDPAENLKIAQTMCAAAASGQARLIAFPEMFMALPQAGRNLSEIAQGLDGDFVEGLKDLAAGCGLFVAAGLWERVEGQQRVANTLVVVSPAREWVAVYRKLHLFDALSVRESETMLAGNEKPPVVSIDDWNLGFAICYDLRFPELFRDLALRGADAVVIPAAWYAGPLKEDHWLTLLRARAIENTCYVLGVNQTGSRFSGRSAAFDPFGVMKAGAGEDPELLMVDLDRQRIVAVRRKLPALEHCRRDLYGPKTGPEAGGKS